MHAALVESAFAASCPVPPRCSRYLQGCKFGDMSPSNLAFAAFPLPRGYANGPLLPDSHAQPQLQTPSSVELPPASTAAALPQKHQQEDDMQQHQQEDGMQDSEKLPERQPGDDDAQGSNTRESLTSLLASCPASLQSGVASSVCRYAPHHAWSCLWSSWLHQKHRRKRHCV
jgi:hypothetical protein